MKKIILSSLVIASGLLASDVSTILPYVATINYDNTDKSTKDRGILGGIYISNGNLDYLTEFNYSHTDISYKDSNLTNLKQDDFTLTFAKYYKAFIVKGGIHYVSTTDTDLGDGTVIIGEFGGYSWRGYDKYSYGLEGYYSYYKDGFDENDIAKKIGIIQFTPYYRFSKYLDSNTRNTFVVKVNHIIANDYISKSYTSYEVENTLSYRKLSTTLKAYGGKMKTGVKDSGHTVYNTKDLLKDGYSIKFGYSINKDLRFSASYAVNNFEEFGQTGETSNSVALAALSYSF